MPRPKKEKPGNQPGEKKPTRSTAPIQIDAELARMAAVIASHDKTSISEIISPLVRQWLLTNYERVDQEMQSRIQVMKEENKRGS